jgi:anti-sigma B factor antagonist
MSQARLATMDVRKINHRTSIIDIHGEVTGAAEDALMSAYTGATQNGAHAILLNFGNLEYMNSSGIGLIVTLLIRVNRQKQRLISYGLSEHYRQIFELTRLNEAIGIYDTEAEALAATES